jgi:hypothetical protein
MLSPYYPRFKGQLDFVGFFFHIESKQNYLERNFMAFSIEMLQDYVDIDGAYTMTLHYHCINRKEENLFLEKITKFYNIDFLYC